MKQQILLAVGLGFLLGIKHATDADHLVAMSTLVSRSKRFGVSWLLGAAWGIGHTVTIVAVGLLIIGLKLAIPARIGAGMELSVGIMLCVLGVMNVAGYGLGKLGIEEHVHEHGHGEEHHHHLSVEGAARSHRHSHAHSRPLEELLRAAGRFQLWRAFGVGLLHGLAGSSAIALMVLAAMPGFWPGMIYLFVFGAGTLAGMIGLSTIMEGALFLAVSRFDLQRLVASGAGWMSLGFGLYIMYTIGFVGWIPH